MIYKGLSNRNENGRKIEFSPLVAVFKKVGNVLVDTHEPRDTYKEVQQFADCALNKVLDKFLSIENVPPQAGFRVPYTDPAEYGEIMEELQDLKSSYNLPEDMSYGEVLQYFQKLQKGGEDNVEKTQTVEKSEQQDVQTDGAASTQA